MSPERGFRRGDLVVGRLVEHGVAPYEFRGSQDLSYYLKLLTSRGERLIWGKGLERALQEAQTKPKVGDVIGARRAGRQPVSVSSRSAAGAAPETALKYRTIWEVEKATFFADRARRARQIRDSQTDAKAAIRASPELKSTYLSLRGAEELAAKRIKNPEDRETFLALIREAIAGSVQRGEPLPEIRLRERSKAPETKPKSADEKPTSDPPRRDEPTR